MPPAEDDCQTEIIIRVTCVKALHQHAIPHSAGGCTPDGVRWSVTWWDSHLVLDDPESPANTDPPVRVNVASHRVVRCRTRKVRRERRVEVNSVNEQPILKA